MLSHPEEVLNNHAEDTNTATGDDLKSRFRRLSLNFGSKDKLRKPPPTPRDPKNIEVNSIRQPFSSFFDGKSSLFSKLSPKPDRSSPAEKEKPSCHNESDGKSSQFSKVSPESDRSSPSAKPSSHEENDWTIV